MSTILVALVLVAIVLLFFYLTKNYNHWEKHGIPCMPGVLPGLGNTWPVLSLRLNFTDFSERVYNINKDSSMVGFYNMRSPALVVRDPELVKTILQTDFASFHRNTHQLDPNLDPLLVKNPFFTYGEKWSTGRKRLTNAFSSMRLKILSETIRQVCKKFDDYLIRKLKNQNKLEVELKDLFSRFTGEVVANSGLGVEGFFFTDEVCRDSFQEVGMAMFQSSVWTGILKALTFLFPALGTIFRIRFLPEKVDRFFRTMIRNVIIARQKESMPRNDFFQLMVDLEKKETAIVDEENLASYALSYFFDGYETSSLTLTFIGYELALHDNVQNKLREEIRSVLSRHNNTITYDALKEMTYMDQVISESQRLHPALGSLTKICTKTFELKGSDQLTYRAEPGTEIVISSQAIHKDPRFWSDPETFDPERFSEDRKNEIIKYTFIPFGEGPRICVGMRMALLQMKACLSALLTKYSLELSPKTKLPLEIEVGNFLTTPKYGVWVNVKPV